MTDLLGALCSAIAYQEGFFTEGSLPQRNRNPGDLRVAPWLTHPTIQNGYWVADSLPIGIAGLYHQVALNVARGYSLRQLINAWAPASDSNNPTVYLANVMKWCGITDSEVPLCTMLELVKPT